MADGKVGTGSKRKERPVKDSSTKDRGSKKVKTDGESGHTKSKKEKSKPIVISKAKHSKKAKVESESDSEDSDSGGAPLADEDGDIEMEDEEILPAEAEGLHPDRAKAVINNSEIFFQRSIDYILIFCRSIVERSACEAKTTCEGAKSCEANGR